jgi:predicted esterase
VIAAGGDVPPELDQEALSRIPTALVARGARDEWYSHAKWTADETRLRQAGGHVHALVFDGGHEWSPEVSAEAGALLDRVTAKTR